MNHKNIIYIILLLTVVNCSQKHEETNPDDEIILNTLEEWLGKEVILDAGIGHYTLTGLDTLTDISHNGEYKILRYIDPNGCTPCRLQLRKYTEFLSEFQDSAHTAIDYICIVATDNTNELVISINQSLDKLPLWIDSTDSLNHLNSFPDIIGLQTFLLDKNNVVLGIGDPVGNPKVRDLYLQIITHSDTDTLNILNPTEIFCAEPEISIGEIHRGDSIKCSFLIKNTGAYDFICNGVTTSCDCTSAELTPQTIAPGETGEIKVIISEPDIWGEFFRTVTLYGNTPVESTFEISGAVIN